MKKKVVYHKCYWERFVPQKDYSIEYSIMTTEMKKPFTKVIYNMSNLCKTCGKRIWFREHKVCKAYRQQMYELEERGWFIDTST